MSTTIPTIDLSLASSASTRPKLLSDLRQALFEVGFLYLSNHGIPPPVIQDLVDALPRLFALSRDVKESVALVNSPHFLGYSGFGSEVTARVRDQREQFEFANELPDRYGLAERHGEEEEEEEALPLYMRLQGPNQWLEEESETQTVPRFREIVQSYIAAMQALAMRFLELANEALGLPPGSLERFTGPQDRIKLVHYRPTSTSTSTSTEESPSSSTSTSSNNNTQGVGPHKDSSGWMTFLLQASSPSIPGLQVLSKDGLWLDAPPVPGTLVVNMGQAFEVATNGVCKATTHRVLLPAGDYDRYSVPFFQGVRPDLTKAELRSLWQHFDAENKWSLGRESDEGSRIDSPFLRGKYDTWGEAQLRTKIRSHRDVGQRWYGHVFEKYVNDD